MGVFVSSLCAPNPAEQITNNELSHTFGISRSPPQLEARHPVHSLFSWLQGLLLQHSQIILLLALWWYALGWSQRARARAQQSDVFLKQEPLSQASPYPSVVASDMPLFQQARVGKPSLKKVTCLAIDLRSKSNCAGSCVSKFLT